MGHIARYCRTRSWNCARTGMEREYIKTENCNELKEIMNNSEFNPRNDLSINVLMRKKVKHTTDKRVQHIRQKDSCEKLEERRDISDKCVVKSNGFDAEIRHDSITQKEKQQENISIAERIVKIRPYSIWLMLIVTAVLMVISAKSISWTNSSIKNSKKENYKCKLDLDELFSLLNSGSSLWNVRSIARPERSRTCNISLDRALTECPGPGRPS